MANKALSFDGLDDKVVVADSASLSTLGAMSIEAWIKHPLNTFEGIISKDTGSDPNREFLLLTHNNNGNIQFLLMSADATNYLGVRGVTDVSDGNWHYVVATWDGVNDAGHIKIWIDGSIDSLNQDFKTETGYTPHNGGADVELGRIQGNNDYCFAGVIDEVRISDKERSQAEIEAIWNSGDPIRFEVDGNTIALWHIDENDGTIFDETDNDNDGNIDGASWTGGYLFPVALPPLSAMAAQMMAAGLI